MFPLKDKNPCPACKIYQGTCICGLSYIGETSRNVAIRLDEHEDVKKDSEPAKHLYEFPDHKFTWKIITSASKKYRKRKNLEAIFIGIHEPKLNNQLETKKLQLFRLGIT